MFFFFSWEEHGENKDVCDILFVDATSGEIECVKERERERGGEGWS